MGPEGSGLGKSGGVSRKNRVLEKRKEGEGLSQDLLQELEVRLFVKCVVGHILEEPPGEREIVEKRMMVGKRGLQSRAPSAQVLA
jgi:hypothetical protein